ncbi:MAG: hypothetical protein NTZ46_00310 [Verrucomicrobia bacterium]|nr:hypothetical protein [Verrucomicrobiota bacterium]
MIIQRTRGSVLLITLLVLLVAIALVDMVMTETATVAQNTNRSRQYQAAQAAASGAVDYAYAVWLKRVAFKHDLLLSGTSLAVTAPSFSGVNAPPGTSGFVYTTGVGLNDGTLKIQALDKYGVAITGSNIKPDVIIGPVNGYPGWWGRTYTYAATARLKVDNGDPNAPSAGARRIFQYTEVPLFQCMYFFQDDLEIYNPANMIISGLIHSNKNLYLSTKTGSSNLTIQGQASYVLPYISPQTCYTEPPGVKGSPAEVSSTDYPPTWSNGGEKAQLHQVSPMSPMGSALDSVFSDTNYSGNPNVSGTYHELIEVPNPSYADPIETDPSSPRRIYNVAAKKGGMIVHVTGTNIVGAASSSAAAVTASSIALTTLSSDGLPVAVAGKTVLITTGSGASLPAAGTTAYNNAVYAFSQALSKQQYNGATKFYDDRENTYMNVVNVDVGLLNTAISNSVAGLYNNVIYIYDDSTSTNPNVVRLKNGAIISNVDGLTIGSLNPVYVQGDYNTGGTTADKTDVPANVSNANNDQSNYKSGYTTKATAIMADGITLLSNNWSDANSANALTSRTAKNTTYNVALLGGYLSSDSISSTYYSGGAINYPRFLEGWSGIYCTYFGSMVELFPSNTKNPWIMPGKTGEYYGAPNRRFNFDTKFSSKSPPGTTNAIVLNRGIWSKW